MKKKELERKINSLMLICDNLMDDHAELMSKHAELMSKYASLVNAYSSLLDANNRLAEQMDIDRKEEKRETLLNKLFGKPPTVQ